MRKDKVFSVSLHESELKEIETLLERLRQETGMKLSRNEFMRKASLAYARILTKGVTKWERETYEKEFRSI